MPLKVKKTPMRRCVGCMESKPKKELVRIAGYEGEVSVDPTGKAKGRGVYLCPREGCFAKAVKKKAISRSVGIEISAEQMDRLSLELSKISQSAAANDNGGDRSSEKEVF